MWKNGNDHGYLIGFGGLLNGMNTLGVKIIFYPHTFRNVYFASRRDVQTLFHWLYTTPRAFMKLSSSSLDT